MSLPDLQPGELIVATALTVWVLIILRPVALELLRSAALWVVERDPVVERVARAMHIDPTDPPVRSVEIPDIADAGIWGPREPVPTVDGEMRSTVTPPHVLAGLPPAARDQILRMQERDGELIKAMGIVVREAQQLRACSQCGGDQVTHELLGYIDIPIAPGVNQMRVQVRDHCGNCEHIGDYTMEPVQYAAQTASQACSHMRAYVSLRESEMQSPPPGRSPLDELDDPPS